MQFSDRSDSVSSEVRSRKPGILDVAYESGFSPTTVSHALNNRGRVSESTRERILAVAERIGYPVQPKPPRPRGTKTGVIGVIARLPAGGAWNIADHERLVQLELALCDSVLRRELSPVILHPRKVRNTLHSIPLDGAVLVDPLPGDDILTLLERVGVPVVTLGRDIFRDQRRHYWVDNNNHARTRVALDALQERGMRSAALLSRNTGQSYLSDVTEAFEQWISEHQVAGRVIELALPFDQNDCYREVRLLCEAGSVDTLYLGLEAFLRPTLEAVQASGLRVPDDIQILVASDGAFACTSRPPVSAIDLRPKQLGMAALDLLLSLVQAPGGPAQARLVDTVMNLRASTRPIQSKWAE